MAKGHKTGGRAKGTPNKKTQDLQAMAEKLGCNPFEILLRFAMRDWKGLKFETETKLKIALNGMPVEVPHITPEMQLDAAEKASQFLYPKRKAIDLSTDEGESPISVTVVMPANGREVKNRN